MTGDKVGSKVREMREHFNLSQKQATIMLDKGISHSSWAYWEGHGCPNDRLADIANMTDNPEQTFDWLTSANGKMPKSISLTKGIPDGAGYKNMPKKKKRSKKAKTDARRNFTPQDRANIIAVIEKMRDDQRISIKDASEQLGVWAGAYNKWQTMDLPEPNGAAVPGLFDESPVSEPDPALPASVHTNLPQTRVPKKSGMPAAADKLTPMAILVMKYSCPRCGQNLSMEE